MEDEDIKKLRRALSYKGRKDLADLFRHSTSYLDESSTFDSRYCSTISYFHIKSHPKAHENIEKLDDQDKQVIFNALRLVYPLRDNEPEITEIMYYPDFGIDVTELIDTKELERISFEYIHEQIKKCKSKIADKDFDGAVTNARTLIESICLFILESKTHSPQHYDGNLTKLYKSVAAILKLSPGDYEDDNLRQILSGIISIIYGVSGLRNTFSDSHGTSPSRTGYKIDERHSILTVNLAKTISEYLFLSYEKSNQ